MKKGGELGVSGFLHFLNSFSFNFVQTHQTVFMCRSNLRVSFKLPKNLSYEVWCASSVIPNKHFRTILNQYI